MANMLDRRNFIKTASVVSVSTMMNNSRGLFAAGTESLKIGLVGCGSRGCGALEDCLKAAAYLNLQIEIVAMADYFKERVAAAATKFNVSPERCFDGIDSYKKVIDSDIDLVLLVTPPIFRPKHFAAAVNAGKHVFMEKPIAVDAPGARRIMESGKLASAKKLCIVVGAQRRHQADYRKTAYAIANGAIGRIISGQVWWCQPALWVVKRKEGETDPDYLVRNWFNFTEMSGDHIVEQHFHNIDVANWFIGRHPESAHGFGGRARRQTGNQYDFFSVDFDYGNNVHVHSMCRQINGCYDRVAEFFIGDQGATWGNGPGQGGYSKPITLPDFEEHQGPYVQEHVDLLRGIIEGKPINETLSAVESNLTCIMGRISAYTGQIVRWRELVDPSVGSPWYGLTLSPSAEDFEKGDVIAPVDEIAPTPGRAYSS